MRLNVQQAAERLLQMNRVVILCHQNPDGDTLGSGYALCRAMAALSKKAKVLCQDPLPPKMSFMAMGLPWEDFSVEHVVSVDVADERLLGDGLASYRGHVELAIDHHAGHRFFGVDTCLYPRCASTCEIVQEIIAAMGIPLTPEMASCLYTGIATDTGCFQYDNVTPHTHRAAAALIQAGCNFKEINRTLFEIKSLAVFKMEQRALDGLELYEGGRIALITVTREMMAETGIGESDLDGIAALSRKIEGVDVGITLKEREDGTYKVSLRTTEAVDAVPICIRFGGGGHARAAGCSFQSTPDQFKPALLQAVREALQA